ncbi:MAG TPA: ATP-binding protein [Anaeromyxobacter sp.]|nr:ATP-binding protein [Anaeromyxobacter sp.]
MRRTSGTARRLFFSFALLVSVFALGTAVMLVQVRGIRRGMAEMQSQVEGVRLALELASAVRDQYAHQAHTIILGNDTHLHFYEAAEERVKALTARVRAGARTDEERAWVGEIERASAELDRVFREHIVPAVLRHDQEYVREEHGRAQLLVSLIQARTDALVQHYEASIAAYQARISALQTGAFHWTLLILVLAPLLAAGVGVYVLRSVAGPVAQLHEGAARLERGDLETRIHIDSNDEFGALARQFNAMTAALKDHQRKLVQHEKLAGIGRLAAGVAHEINNPLAVILGYARLLGKKAEGPAREDLRAIEEEALRAKAIVDGLLELSRPVEVCSEPVDLRALADEVVGRLSGTRLLDGVQVEVSGSARTAGDARKLRQVVVNLVRNAAEAAGAGGRVEVALAEGAEGACLAVSDTGPGLSEEVRARLFEPFFSQKEGGTGLGLAVSKGIVEAHGGTIEAEPLEPCGARFAVRLPALP